MSIMDICQNYFQNVFEIAKIQERRLLFRYMYLFISINSLYFERERNTFVANK
jgi:hypothetical protein